MCSPCRSVRFVASPLALFSVLTSVYLLTSFQHILPHSFHQCLSPLILALVLLLTLPFPVTNTYSSSSSLEAWSALRNAHDLSRVMCLLMSSDEILGHLR